MKRQVTDWEIIFANYRSDKRLVSRTHKKKSQNLTVKKMYLENGQKRWTDISWKSMYRRQIST